MAQPIEKPTAVEIGTVMQDQGGQQWTCRRVDSTRGPLFTPACVTQLVPTWVMSSEDELADSGVILTAVAA